MRFLFLLTISVFVSLLAQADDASEASREVLELLIDKKDVPYRDSESQQTVPENMAAAINYCKSLPKHVKKDDGRIARDTLLCAAIREKTFMIDPIPCDRDICVQIAKTICSTLAPTNTAETRQAVYSPSSLSLVGVTCWRQDAEQTE